jgi:glycosidase
MFSRGVPTIYYGDEQGFVGDGGDQDARQDMFPSRVATYNDDRLVGSSATTAQSNFDTGNPIYRALARMARIRAADPALRRGEQRVLNYGDTPGLYAIARLAPDGSGQTIVAFNTGTTPLRANLWTDATLRDRRFESVSGDCARRAPAPGSYPVEIPALGYIVCRVESGAR